MYTTHWEGRTEGIQRKTQFAFFKDFFHLKANSSLIHTVLPCALNTVQFPFPKSELRNCNKTHIMKTLKRKEKKKDINQKPSGLRIVEPS